MCLNVISRAEPAVIHQPQPCKDNMKTNLLVVLFWEVEALHSVSQQFSQSAGSCLLLLRSGALASPL